MPSLQTYPQQLIHYTRSLIRKLSINQKIGYGYALSMGIALLGTVAGLTVGDHYQQQAKQKLEYTYSQQSILSELQNEVLIAHSHAERLVPLLGNSAWLESEVNNFYESILRSQNLLSELRDLAKNSDSLHNAEDVRTATLLKNYENTVDSYLKLVSSLLERIQSRDLLQQDVTPIQQQLATFTNHEISLKFDRVSQVLSQILSQVKSQRIQAQNEFKKAEMLRVQITLASILFSVAIATLLAYYTSHAIARPIKWVTQVANRAAEQSNYYLRAPVLAQDEVGLLATSLNQLIERIGQQLKALQDTQAQLIQTEKMSSLGSMVAGIAHEINNPVNFIYGNLNYTSLYVKDLMELVRLYQEDYPHPSPAIQQQIEMMDLEFLLSDLPKVMSSMEGGAERIRDIVVSLRNFSRLDEAEMKRVDIHQGLDSTLLILNHRLHRYAESGQGDIAVIKKYGELPLVECYASQLNQVFMNILTNAIDALDEMQMQRQTNTEKSLAQPIIPTIIIRTERVDYQSIRVGIWENGVGIPPEIQRRLFDPFFTTKAPGKGTGLGLAIAYQIVAKHQGRIEVISEPGEGTEFGIVLPVKSSANLKMNFNRV